MVMELNDKEAIQELVTKKIEMYTMEMEKRAESVRNLQVEKSYDYIQAGLDSI
jgi:competence protein ComGC